MADLSNKKVLVLASNRGVEQDELVSPVESLRSAGAKVEIAAPQQDKIQTLVGDWDSGKILEADLAFETVDDEKFDLLLVPGGTLNADNLRVDDEAQRIIKSFAATGRPVASICHGPWLLVETGLVRGKTLTSYQSIKTDVVNAGGQWVDEEVFRCPAGKFVLITSRNPGDLDAFNAAIIEELGA
ncbi:type 1 glutamine amidotransferase domain-containing protein [Glutamicibacter protophormiae]|uniref:Protease I n=1 Tax=Glutamicibacter protophormiae TaxID=37930 RepID=A0ABS4XLK1_GLUPR|nr:type 1 glutamine amidotransferase domain-containing protein [Glutamicibacter protophormiae]MBP2397382.1 protease I [Glutamicibacter protophormiae]GGL79648.1 glutamine amidotransferase [Glutamicibacter protophormiae]